MEFQKKVVYQIYPKSFYDSDGDGIGDLQGVIEKLDYLADLGIDMIWMTPFFLSPQQDNGYDVADYRCIDPSFGTMEIFEQLVKEAKKRRIDIMLDMVFNHTSTAHIWFQKALQNDPKYKQYYIFRKGKSDGSPPTNWKSKFGGNAWAYVPELDEYYLHLFDRTQADLNWDNPDVRDELCEILQFWIDKGVYGFRFDVINLISKPQLMQDDDEGDGRACYTDGPNVHTYLKELNERTFGKDQRIVTVGEMSSTSLESCIKYAGADANELSMVFHFHHLKVDYREDDKWKLKPFDFYALKQLFITWQLEMQKQQAWDALFWCNHDQPRAVSRFGNDQMYHKQSAKMLATAIHCMRGTPYIYQGEEIGMTNAYFHELSQYRDVESINYYHILKQEGLKEAQIMSILQERSRDNSRTPMQWNDHAYAGFSTQAPWISVNPNASSINAAQSQKEHDSIYAHYQKLIAMRKQYDVIAYGTFAPLLIDHPHVYAYRRCYKEECLLVINNFYACETTIQLNESKDYVSLISNYANRDFTNVMHLQPYESIVFLQKHE